MVHSEEVEGDRTDATHMDVLVSEGRLLVHAAGLVVLGVLGDNTHDLSQRSVSWTVDDSRVVLWYTHWLGPIISLICEWHVHFEEVGALHSANAVASCCSCRRNEEHRAVMNVFDEGAVRLLDSQAPF